MFSHYDKTTPDNQMTATTTLEEHEIKARATRAEKTQFRIKLLENNYYPFANYEVTGETKICYLVEIRSLKEKINSCSCPDFQVNTLKTCKHIEGVVNFIKKKSKRKFVQFANADSKRIEIFLDPLDSRVYVCWPKESENTQALHTLLDPYLSSNQTLLSDPLISVPSIINALKNTSEQLQLEVRFSPFLMQWLAERQLVQEMEHDKKRFLADVEAGKRSMRVLSSKLFPYQEQGMLHLAFKGRAILADEMGLGKTIQSIAACEILRKLDRIHRVLVVSPASLKGEWEEQIAQFSGLPTMLVNGSRTNRLACYKKEAFFYLMNYEQIRADFEEIQVLINPDVLILDEAQRIKNWETKTAWAVKQIKTPYAFVLTGTPIENRIDELYSIMQVVNPKILGPLFQFHQDFYRYDEQGKQIGYKNLKELYHRLDSFILRRRKKDVEDQLPERTINHYFVKMDPEQVVRYEEYSAQVSRLLQILKKRPFTSDESKKLQRLLACMRMTADTPYILDETCFECPKLEELEAILRELLEDEDNKIIIFSEWERMLFLVRELTNRLGLDYAMHTGSVSQKKRREEIRRFKENPRCKIFLSTDSGSVGLNLQVANVVINMDLPWNPARLEQRIARAWRKNQARKVQVINLITENTIEHRMLSTLAMKQAVADIVLDSAHDVDEMPLPSASRETMIQKLESLTGGGAYSLKIASACELPPTPTPLKDELLARYSDRIHLLEEHENGIFLVVDKMDPSLKTHVNQIVQQPFEILDIETYSTLQRLASAGFVQLNTKPKEIVYQSHLIQSNKHGVKQHQLEKATALYKEAERQLRMANLLKSGDFLLEALPAAREALSKGLSVCKTLEKDIDDKGLRLKEDQENPENPEAFIDLLSLWIQDLGDIVTQLALGLLKAAF